MTTRSSRAAQIFEQVNGPDGCAGLLNRLEKIGLPARHGRAKTTELRHLRAPALILDGKGQWQVLIKSGETEGEFFSTSGPVPRTWARVWPTGEGEYIDFIPGFDWDAKIPSAGLNRARRQTDLVLPLLGAAAALNLLSLWSSWFVSRMVDASQAKAQAVAVGVVAMAALGVVQAGLVYVQYRLYSALRLGGRFELQGELLRRILSLPYSVIAHKTSGETGYAMDSAYYYADLLSSLLGHHWLDVIQCLVGLGVVFWVSPTAGIAMVAFGGASIGLQVVSARRRVGLMAASAEATSTQIEYLSEALAGAVTVKSQGAERYVVERWFRMVKAEVALDQRASIWGIYTTGLTTSFARVFSLSLLITCAYLVMSGRLGLGGMLLVIQVGIAQVTSISMLAETLPNAVLGFQPRLERIRDLVNHPSTERKQASDKVRNGLVVVEDVSFAYPGGTGPVVRGINFQVEPGGRHWLKTPSGSGKSTLLRLLAGLYEPTQGTITIDGMAASRVASGVLYLPQSIQLLSGSVFNNLEALSGVTNREKLIEIARQTGLDEFVGGLPMGYRTPLQFAGANLSGGQRQLIALTAALASDAKVLLLDEAMANLDWAIRPRLASLDAFNGRTVIYASHDQFFAS